MRREGWALGLFLLLTMMVSWGILVAQPLCRHECFDTNNCGHCGDWILRASPPCLGVEICMIQDPDCRLMGGVHVKDKQQCTHSGQSYFLRFIGAQSFWLRGGVRLALKDERNLTLLR